MKLLARLNDQVRLLGWRLHVTAWGLAATMRRAADKKLRPQAMPAEVHWLTQPRFPPPCKRGQVVRSRQGQLLAKAATETAWNHEIEALRREIRPELSVLLAGGLIVGPVQFAAARIPGGFGIVAWFVAEAPGRNNIRTMRAISNAWEREARLRWNPH